MFPCSGNNVDERIKKESTDRNVSSWMFINKHIENTMVVAQGAVYVPLESCPRSTLSQTSNDAAFLQWCYFKNSWRFKGEERHEITVQVLSNSNSTKYSMNFWNTSLLPVDLHNYFLYSWSHQWGLYLGKPQQGKLCKRYNWRCCSELKFSQFQTDLTAAGCKQDEIVKQHETKELENLASI